MLTLSVCVSVFVSVCVSVFVKFQAKKLENRRKWPLAASSAGSLRMLY